MLSQFICPWARLAVLVPLFWISLYCGGSQHVSAQEDYSKWSDAQNRALEADFVRLETEAVVLKLRRDGREVAVPLADLSLESHLQAVKLANPAAFSKPVPKAEVKAEVAYVDIPELTISLDGILRSPFPPNTTLDKFLEIVKRERAEGNYFVGWHTLPPKMQADVQEVVIKFVEVAEPATLKQIQLVLTDLATITRDKKEFIFGVPAIANSPPLSAMLERQWPVISGFLSALASEENWAPDNFKQGKVPRWLANLNMQLAPYLVAMNRAASESGPEGGSFSFLQYAETNIVSQSAESAEVEYSIPGQPPQKRRLQKLGNIWIQPAEMTAMSQQLAQLKNKLGGGAETEVRMWKLSLTGITAAVRSLARPGTQDEFDNAAALLESISVDLIRTASAAGLSAGTAVDGAPGGPARGGRPRGSGR